VNNKRRLFGIVLLCRYMYENYLSFHDLQLYQLIIKYHQQQVQQARRDHTQRGFIHESSTIKRGQK
jgi:hypothetical protein